MEPEPAQKVGSSSNFKSAPAEKPWLRPALQHCLYVNVLRSIQMDRYTVPVCFKKQPDGILEIEEIVMKEQAHVNAWETNKKWCDDACVLPDTVVVKKQMVAMFTEL